MVYLLTSSVTYAGIWITQSLTWCCQLCSVLCGILMAMYWTGWLHRFLWFMAEREATKLLNGTTVTSSTFQIDIFRGKIWISNLIIHSPKQDVWHWEAPVFARIGKVYVEANLVSCLFSLLFLGEELPLDFSTVLVSDIQVFIERKHNVYNFLLLDPHVIIPAAPQPSATTLEPIQSDEDDDDDVVFVPTTVAACDDADSSIIPVAVTTSSSSTRRQSQSKNSVEYSSIDPISLDPNATTKQDEEEKAQQVVEHIVHSVRRATVAGGDRNPVVSLLDQYRHTLANQLKAFTSQDTSTGNKASTTAMMQEGVNLIKHVTANIAEKTVQAQQVIIPARRTLPGERPVYGRVGRVLIENMRIFVRENHRFNNTTGSSTETSSVNDLDAQATKVKHTSGNETVTSRTASSISSWHPPIVIPAVAIRSNEFCPPLAAKESKSRPQSQNYNSSLKHNENEDDYDPKLMPALYQTMDVYVDIVWKRVLAEVAKSNTDQLFQTAMGEVVNLFVDSKDMTQDEMTPSS
jgi:hypothetical protein